MKEIIIVFIVFLYSCSNSSKPLSEEQNNLTVKKEQKKPKTNIRKIDSARLLQESSKEDDIPVNDYLIEELKPTRENFKKINSISTSEWLLVLNKNIEGKSTEGGEANFYYYNDSLYKIIERNFGESLQELNEYYLLNGKLSFVFEKRYNYNRPIYWDSTTMKENNDNQIFDINKSEIIETRSYFENNGLIHQLYSQDCGAPFTGDYLQQEQKRILANFDELIKLSKQK